MAFLQARIFNRFPLGLLGELDNDRREDRYAACGIWEYCDIRCRLWVKCRDMGVTMGKLQAKSAGVNPSTNYSC